MKKKRKRAPGTLVEWAKRHPKTKLTKKIQRMLTEVNEILGDFEEFPK